MSVAQVGLARRVSFSLFLTDGRVAIDDNPAERSRHTIFIGRKNWLFAGAGTGGRTLARAMTIIGTAKLNGLNPQACLADVLLPWNWAPIAAAQAEAA